MLWSPLQKEMPVISCAGLTRCWAPSDPEADGSWEHLLESAFLENLRDLKFHLCFAKPNARATKGIRLWLPTWQICSMLPSHWRMEHSPAFVQCVLSEALTGKEIWQTGENLAKSYSSLFNNNWQVFFIHLRVLWLLMVWDMVLPTWGRNSWSSFSPDQHDSREVAAS